MNDIRAAYKRFALQLHPDVTGGNEVSSEPGWIAASSALTKNNLAYGESLATNSLAA